MEIIWHGTASIEIKSMGNTLLFDPFVPLTGAEWKTDLSTYDDFPIIFLTHGHFDHIVNIPEIIKRNPNTRVYGTSTPLKSLKRKKVPERNLIEVGYGENLSLEGFSVEVYHGKHAVLPKLTCRRFFKYIFNRFIKNIPYILVENIKCPENDETVVYRISAEGKQIILLGSMNIREDVSYPVGSDLLILPYNGWEDNYPPAERIIKQLKPEKVLLTHWDDTFPPLTGKINREQIYKRFGNTIYEIRNNESLTI